MADASIVVDAILRSQQFQAGIKGMMSSMGGVASSIGAVGSALAGLAGAAATAFGANKLVAMAAAQEDALKRLSAAITLNGQNGEEWAGKLNSVAGELQSLTRFGDETTLALMRNAAAQGVSADKLEDFAKAAISINAIAGGEGGLEGTLKALVLAQQGEYTMLARQIPALRAVNTDTERAAIVNAMLAKGWQQAQVDATTYTGSLAQMWNAIGDIGETIGGTLLPTVVSMAQGIRDAAVALNSWATAHPTLTKILSVVGVVGTLVATLAVPVGLLASAAVAGFGAIGAALAAVLSPIGIVVAGVAALAGAFIYSAVEGETFGAKLTAVYRWIADMSAWMWDGLKQVFAGILYGYAWVETGVLNLRTTWNLAITAMLYYGLKWYNDIKHWFTVAFPAYLGWFADNWYNVLVDLASATGTIFTNMGENIYNFFDQISRWLGGEGFDFRWTGLLEGFEATTRALPEIAARQVDAYEESLRSQMQGLIDELAGPQQERFRQLMDAFGLSTGAAPGKGSIAGGTATSAAAPVLATTAAAEAAKSGTKVGTIETAVQTYRRIMQASLGRDSPERAAIKTAENTATLAAESKQQTDVLKEINAAVRGDTAALARLG